MTCNLRFVPDRHKTGGTRLETLTEGGATCAAWRKSERGYDLSEARFNEIERDLHYLYEQLKDL